MIFEIIVIYMNSVSMTINKFQFIIKAFAPYLTWSKFVLKYNLIFVKKLDLFRSPFCSFQRQELKQQKCIHVLLWVTWKQIFQNFLIFNFWPNFYSTQQISPLIIFLNKSSRSWVRESKRKCRFEYAQVVKNYILILY